MFHTVLIANRGEIAVRITKTLRRMGIQSVAVYSDADAGARHVTEADLAIRLGPAAASESYLHVERVIEAALATGAQAIHPGYGFLAENVALADACARAGLVFIGPPVPAIEAMGDKIRAKQTVQAAGVPVVPGRAEPGLDDDQLLAAATEIGYPVLLKPSAGGGGKGMRLVRDPAEFAEAAASARREARGAFGDDTLLIERFVDTPRHIEIQVLADTHGNVVHLGERECSLQRRHQKIVEEAPSPLLDERLRQRMGQAAVDAAAAVGYSGAGTVEFIVSGAAASASGAPDEFFFMEMNTRLQVEHPVTELVTGIDLVEQQVRVAAGEKLAVDYTPARGHAVEVRVYAEDPDRGFLPTGGEILALAEPAHRVRVDSGIAVGQRVGSDYDPMLAKYVAHGSTREHALRELRTALGETVLLGVTTNIPFLRSLLADPDVQSGQMDTGLVERRIGELTGVEPVPDEVLAAAVLELLDAREPVGGYRDPWDIPSGWRLGEPAWSSWLIGVAGAEPTEVRVRGTADAAEVAVGAGEPVAAWVRRADNVLTVGFAGRITWYSSARQDDVLWLAAQGRSWALHETKRLDAVAGETAEAGGGPVTSPMPGTVLLVNTSVGATVRAGAALLVVEAMKMEHTITAPVDGVVTELPVRAGSPVGLGETLVVIAQEEGGDD
ncbi:acetyl-CoA/propionyl-CoA carboxylase biotin carboxyl carrier protein [Tamaricihabitans halophyticus]|uniref:Biotin-dependent 3-methylcrotonyl-coenzyme A carboxylase alpha1 subunit n=1 Tax=Tamaricihabitans halophyticus TaxID=1262583 RepID=A0A4R2QQA2_9PSEU|nr:biotin carboxylase N-terminal domain-containing protein [Tamaricihabitans halophyticus]TCP51912.1 acetyl-CoA/propionyl-CoA carboxylase biotin carboxyl carrier protein [Tamaricihabitans halophyticus]